MHAYIHAYMHTYIHTYIDILTHAPTHTHVFVQEIGEMSLDATNETLLAGRKFAAIISGKLEIISDGSYKFCVRSSDDAKVRCLLARRRKDM